MLGRLALFLVSASLPGQMLGSPAARPGVQFSKRDELPVLNLPYGSYQAANYSSSSDIYTFKNIRYAAPPVADLRWAKPAPPLPETTVQNGSYGPKCVQSPLTGVNVLGPGNMFPIGGDINKFLGGLNNSLFEGGREDCLFLDVYVPGKAVRNPSMKLPVVVWVYGGAYVFGSKDAFQSEFSLYDGSGMIEQSGNGLIFVTMNYRLGAFGFLGGTTMEREGLPNAGLWDQRAAFQWVQDHIHLLGGDKDQVTAMGQSAGAGSIIHHMVAQGGKLDPLFRKAILQSPAFQWMWDRNGLTQKRFNTFASLAGCDPGGDLDGGGVVACLRRTDIDTLSKANTALNKQVAPGSFAVGPATDGSFIRQLPALEFRTGNWYGGIESVVVSHCADETSLFISGSVSTDDRFRTFLGDIFPNYTRTTGVNDLILQFYPSPTALGSPFLSESNRVETFLRDSCFTCHMRHLTQGIGDSRSWNMQFSASPGIHGADLVPTFYNPNFNDTGASSNLLTQLAAALFVPSVAAVIGGLSTGFQSYMTSYVLTGDPNTKRNRTTFPPTTQWDRPNTTGEQTTNVMDVGNLGFNPSSSDWETLKSSCDFWFDIQAAVTSLGGYAPPGAVVDQGLVQVPNNPTESYVGGNSR